MKIVLSGGSGFLGRALTDTLVERGHDVVILSRHAAPPRPSVRYVVWRPDTTDATGHGSQAWTHEMDDAAAIINLAGAGIADRRWTAARKVTLRSSRLLSTRQLIGAVRGAAHRPVVFIQGSAIGFYGSTGDQVVDESSPHGSDFLARLCVDWEAEGRAAESLGCRVVCVRTGIVLGQGGALAKMKIPFQLFIGGPLASGRQYTSWIHIDDWVALVFLALEKPQISGPLNATAPVPVTNAALSQALGRALHRPSWLPTPHFALRVVFGELADAGFINGQRVVPTRALGLGYTFKYPAIDTAMTAAVAAS